MFNVFYGCFKRVMHSLCLNLCVLKMMLGGLIVVLYGSISFLKSILPRSI